MSRTCPGLQHHRTARQHQLPQWSPTHTRQTALSSFQARAGDEAPSRATVGQRLGRITGRLRRCSRLRGAAQSCIPNSAPAPPWPPPNTIRGSVCRWARRSRRSWRRPGFGVRPKRRRRGTAASPADDDVDASRRRMILARQWPQTLARVKDSPRKNQHTVRDCRLCAASAQLGRDDGDRVALAQAPDGGTWGY